MFTGRITRRRTWPRRRVYYWFWDSGRSVSSLMALFTIFTIVHSLRGWLLNELVFWHYYYLLIFCYSSCSIMCLYVDHDRYMLFSYYVCLFCSVLDWLWLNIIWDILWHTRPGLITHPAYDVFTFSGPTQVFFIEYTLLCIWKM